MALDKVKDDMLQDNLVFPGSTTQFPSLTTTQRDALTPAVGMVIYNSTVGNLQQYTSTGWASIAAQPSITGVTYPTESGAVLTALDATGSSDAAQTLIINGSNFTSTVTVEIQVSGTYSAFSSSTSVNGARTQITCTGVTKRAAADNYTLRVTNSTGLSASTTVNFSADPSFSTAANLGTVYAGQTLSKSIAFTGTKVIQGATAKPTWMTVTGNTSTADNGSGDTTFDATGSPATLGGTIANSGTSQTHTFSIIVRDAENQTFNRDFSLTAADLPTGGNHVFTKGNYRHHVFTSNGTFVTYADFSGYDIFLVGGGGASSNGNYAGYAGGGGHVTWYDASNTTSGARIISAGNNSIVVGAGGDHADDFGDNSTGLGLTAYGGNKNTSGTGDGTDPHTGKSGKNINGTSTDYSRGGFQGGNTSTEHAGGGAGAGEDGANAGSGDDSGGDGIQISWFTLRMFLGYTGSEDDSTGLYFGGGGGGGAGSSISAKSGGAGGGGTGARINYNAATAGTANRGGGAGGGAGTPGTFAAGGSGIVVIRFPL